MQLIPAPRPGSNPHTITVNLDQASRSSVIAAACALLLRSGARAWDLVEWRQRASAWDHDELLTRAAECGVKYMRGNQPYSLPAGQ
jgi:hypothetical protein